MKVEVQWMSIAWGLQIHDYCIHFVNGLQTEYTDRLLFLVGIQPFKYDSSIGVGSRKFYSHISHKNKVYTLQYMA